MSTRKYLSGYEKRKKKRKTEEFLQSQVGADDACFQPELGWSVWGSLGWTKMASGLNWRMPDRQGCSSAGSDVALSCKKNQKEERPARALPVAAPMPKS